MCVWAEERRETVEENERMVSESVKRVVYMMRVRASERARALGRRAGRGSREGKEREKIKERGHLKCEKCASDDEVIRVGEYIRSCTGRDDQTKTTTRCLTGK